MKSEIAADPGLVSSKVKLNWEPRFSRSRRCFSLTDANFFETFFSVLFVFKSVAVVPKPLTCFCFWPFTYVLLLVVYAVVFSLTPQMQDDKLKKADIDAQVEMLEKFDKTWTDVGAIVDCVVFHDGETYQ